MASKLGTICVFVAICIATQQTVAQRPSVPGDSLLQYHSDIAQRFPNFAQTLTEQSLKRHPGVLVVAFHVQIPGEQINRVVAINQAQWSKFLWRPSDDIDTDTAKTQRTVVQVIPATHRMEVHMPLRTKAGNTIATLVCVWNFKDEEEAPELMRKSQQIRDEIAPSITSTAQLLGTP
ncbi:MAG TPA: hypothetical protein VGT08_04340 [Terracidiphilus sp.]|nr:hypothetical protein [Terracidiphilus sp.]